MKTHVSLLLIVSLCFQANMLQGTLPAGLTLPTPTIPAPITTTTTTPATTTTSPAQSPAQALAVQLGNNRLGRFGAWASLGITSLLSSIMMYKTGIQLFDAALQKVPFLDAYHTDTAPAMSLFVTTPLSALALMKYGPLVWYSFYIFYAGERMSPLLARNALRDVQVYVQHLHVIKAIQQDLFDVIAQINQDATAPVSTTDVQLTADVPAVLQKKQAPEVIIIDPAILNTLQSAIEQDEAYVHTILQQLQQFLSEQELEEFEQELQVKSAALVYAIAYDLQDQAQAIIDVLKMSQGQDMGSDAAVLSQLITDLVTYWQNYTQSLADGIDASVRFCNNVHLVEQFIVGWLDRSLLCV